jgi:hypothetical protein
MIKVLHLMKNYAGNLPLHNAMIMGIDPEKFEANCVRLRPNHSKVSYYCICI